MSNLDKNIDLNLEIVYKGKNHSVMVGELTNVDGDYLGRFEAMKMADKLEKENLLERDNEFCELTRFGIEVYENGGWLIHLENENSRREEKFLEQQKQSELQEENLHLQNDNLKYTQSIREKEEEIRRLSSKNLKLQNRQLKWYITFSIIGFILGAIVTNLELILKYFNQK